MPLRKSSCGRIPVKLRNAVWLIIRRNKLVEYFARERSDGCNFEWQTRTTIVYGVIERPAVALVGSRGAETLERLQQPPDVVRRKLRPAVCHPQPRSAAVPKVAIFTTLKRLEPPSFEEGFDEILDVRAAEGSGFAAVRRGR